MRVKTYLSLFAIVLIAASCDSSTNDDVVIDPVNETPAVLVEETPGWSMDSYSGRGKGYDIINDLYQEAVDKDARLGEFDNELEDLQRLNAKAQENPLNYLRTNSKYWNMAQSYANRIADTLLRDELLAMTNTWQDRYNERVDPLNKSLSSLDSSNRSLNDRVLLMKVLVTQPMIANYQKNEYPAHRTLDSLAQALDALEQRIADFAPLTE